MGKPQGQSRLFRAETRAAGLMRFRDSPELARLREQRIKDSAGRTLNKKGVRDNDDAGCNKARSASLVRLATKGAEFTFCGADVRG